MEPHHHRRRTAALAHQAAQRVAYRHLTGCIINDVGEIPEVGDRVVFVEIDTEHERGADLTFDSGKQVFLHADLPYTGPQDSDTAAWQEETLDTLASRVAARHMEAAAGEWLQWMVQPLQVIWKHHKDFVQGPVDDAMDAIIKELAPVMVKAIGEQEIDADVDEFMDGAIRGKWDAEKGLLADPPRGSDDLVDGYQWGFANPDRVKPGNLPPDVKKQVVQEALADFRHRVTEEVVKRLLKQAWHAVSPATTFKAIVTAVKKHGWKLGIGFALFELSEHFLIPSLLTAITGKPEMMGLATLPIGEIIYAIAFRVMGRTPHEVDKLDEAGHLDWYEARFGPVRIAALAR